MINRILNFFRSRWAKTSSSRYINYLRKKGIKIGKGCIFRSPSTARIDLTRPCLVEIGDNVDMNMNFQILTHDWLSRVFRNYYHELIPSSGKVRIGNNIYFGTNVIILKGVTIGDNCIIAAGSIVTKSIPDNSVAAGVPAKVISTLDDYFKKRKVDCVEEALEYARCIKERYNRIPTMDDFWEEFPLFISGKQKELHNQLIVSQLGSVENYEKWCKLHNSLYENIDKFLEDAGVK